MVRVACLTADISKCKRVSEATRQTVNDVARYCLDMGFTRLIINKCYRLKYLKGFFKFLISALNHDFLIIPYPLFYRPLASSLLADIEVMTLMLLGRLTKYILYVYDLPLDQALLNGFHHLISTKALNREREVFSRAYKILCFNEVMKRVLMKRYGISENKFLEFKLLDYGHDIRLAINLSKYNNIDRLRIIYATSNYSVPIVRSAVLNFICQVPSSEKFTLIFVGFNGEYINSYGKPNVTYLGGFRGNEYIKVLSESHLGLMLKISAYNEYGTTSKFSSYMLAGLPVLVPRNYIYLSRIVSEFNVGIIYDRPSDIPDAIKSYSSNDFKRMSTNAYRLGLKLCRGLYFKKTILDALK